MAKDRITVEVLRSNQAGQQHRRFQVPYDHRHSVLTLLNYIYENQDPTLGYRHYHCGRGICNSCRMNINGKTRKACAVTVPPGSHIVLRPHDEEVVYDLVTVIGSRRSRRTEASRDDQRLIDEA